MRETLIGINIPWWNGGYGHDLGINYSHPDWPVTFDEKLVMETFEFMKSLNIHVFRFWLFERGEGLVYNSSGKITGLDKLFTHNLKIFVDAVNRYRLKVYYTLLDANSILRDKDYITDSIITQPGNRKIFCETILPQLLEILGNTVWAIDICNEPEAAISGENGNYTKNGYSWEQVFEGLHSIKTYLKKLDSTIQLTISSGFHEDHNIWNKHYSDSLLDLDFLDFHSHRTDGYIPPLIQSKSTKKIIIGELSVCEKLSSPISNPDWRKSQFLLNEKIYSPDMNDYYAVFLWRLDPVFSRESKAIDTLIHSTEKSLVLYYPFNKVKTISS